MNFLCANENEDLMHKIFQFRYEIFCLEKKFHDKNKFWDSCETDDYDINASHFAAVDDNGEIVGYLRLIHSFYGDLPIEKIAPGQIKYNLAHYKPSLSEISRFAIKKKYRRHNDEFWSTNIQKGLYKIVYQASKELGITHLCSIMEEQLFKALKKFSIIFQTIGPTFYNHGPVAPYLCEVPNIHRDAFLNETQFQFRLQSDTRNSNFVNEYR